jgi:hypothetical protein
MVLPFPRFVGVIQADAALRKADHPRGAKQRHKKAQRKKEERVNHATRLRSQCWRRPQGSSPSVLTDMSILVINAWFLAQESQH